MVEVSLWLLILLSVLAVIGVAFLTSIVVAIVLVPIDKRQKIKEEERRLAKSCPEKIEIKEKKEDEKTL